MKRSLTAFLSLFFALSVFAQAPNVTANPVDAELCAGGDTLFAVTATGNNLTYQWQVALSGIYVNLTNDGIHSGVTDDTLHIIGAQSNMNGLVYRCVVSGSLPPPDTSSSATLTVYEAPFFTSQPNFSVVCAGTGTSFSVTAGGGNVTYQWQVDSTGGGFVDLSATATFTNVTTANLDLTTTYNALDEVLFRCIATNACGSDTSNAGTLRVDKAIASSISVTSSPANPACEGLIELTASGTNIPAIASLQWELNGVLQPEFDTIYSSSNFNDGDAISVWLITDNACSGKDTVQSNTIVLNIIPATDITADPTDAAACDAGGTSFTVAADGDGLAYQWQLDSNGVFIDIVNDATHSGANTATLSLSNANTAMNGWQYRVAVTGTCGSDTSDVAALTVDVPGAPAISIAVNPVGVSCETAPLETVIWTDRVGVTTTGDLICKTAASGAWSGGAASVQTIDEGGYVETIITQVNTDRAFGVSDINADAGFSADCSFYLSSAGGWEVWENVSGPLASGSYALNDVFRIAVENGLVVFYHNGDSVYTCGATPTLPLIADVTFFTNGACLDNVTILPSSVQHTFTASPVNAARNTTYQWMRNGMMAGSNDTIYAGADFASGDSIVCVMISDNACSAGIDTVVSNSIVLTLDTATRVLEQPADTIVCDGSPAGFALVSAGKNQTWKWQIDSTGSGFVDLTNTAPFSNVTTSAMNISAATGDMDGYRFRCIVAGDCGTSISQSVTLKVDANVVPTLSLTVDPVIPGCESPSLSDAILNGTNVTINGNSLTGGDGVGWNSGGSADPSVNGGGCVEWTISSATTSEMMGFSSTPGTVGFLDINYALYTRFLGDIQIFENGISRGLFGTYQAGDRFAVCAENGVVTYSRNDVVFYTSTVPASDPLVVDYTIFTVGGGFDDVQISSQTQLALDVQNEGRNANYTWLLNGVSVATSSDTYTQPQFDNGDTLQVMGTYESACFGNDTVFSNTIVLQLFENTEILSSPTDTTTCVGSSTTFSASANGANLTYQWQVNAGSGWMNLANNLTYSDVQSPTLNITNAALSMDGYLYRCQVFGSCGEESTTAARLNVDANLPISISITADTAAITCETPAYGDPVTWSNTVNVTVMGSSIVKSSGSPTAWDGGAFSDQLVYQGGYAEAVVPTTTTSQMFGLSLTDTDQNFTTLDYAIYTMATGMLYTWDGNNVILKGTWANGDRIRIALENDSVWLSINGVLFDSLPNTVGGPLHLDVSLYDVGAGYNQVVIANQPVFTANVTNQPSNSSLQWLVNGVPQGVSDSIYTSSSFADGDVVACRLVFDNVCTGLDSVTSNSIALSVVSDTRVTGNPADALICELSDTSFAVTGTGQNLTYQWQIDSTGTGFVDVVNDAVFSGSNSAMLSLTGTPISLDGASFRCWIMGDCGSEVSEAAALEIESGVPPGISITANPGGPTCVPPLGQPVTWINTAGVNVTGDTLTKTDATGWTAGAASAENVLDGGYVEMTVIETTTARMLGLSSSDGGPDFLSIDYALYLTSNAQIQVFEGGNPVSLGIINYQTGDVVGLQVNAGMVEYYINDSVFHTSNVVPTLPLLVDVSIYDTGGTIADVIVGNSVLFEASTSNLPANVSFDWFLNGIAQGVNDTTFTQSSFADGDSVVCMLIYQSACVSGQDTVISNSIVLTILATTEITAQPVDITICNNVDTSFSVAASGSNLAYQWQVDSTGTGFENLLAGGAFGAADSSVLTISPADMTMNGYLFRCIVAGDCGTEMTEVVALTVDTVPPGIVVQPTNISTCAGVDTMLTMTATGVGLVYQWQQSTDDGQSFQDLSNGGVFSGTNSASLTFTGVTVVLDSLQYRCIVSGDCWAGDTSDVAMVTVLEQPTVDSQPASVTVCTGDTAMFTIAASGDNVTYQWLRSTDGGLFYFPLANSGNNSGVTTPTLTVTDVLPSMNGYLYYCIVSGACEPAMGSNAALLIVTQDPEVDDEPEDATICEGDDATFTITAIGDNLNFQWQETSDGTNYTDLVNSGVYSGVTTTSLTVSGTMSAMAGNQYRCILTGPCAADTTDAATLNLNVLPIANFVFQAGDMLVAFTDQSFGAESWSWDFDDGNTSTAQNTSNLYAANGTYDVMLTVTNECGSDDTIKTVVLAVGTEEVLTSSQLEIFPNPTRNSFQLTFANADVKSLDVRLRNPLGQVVAAERIGNLAGTYRQTFDLSGQAAGIYFLELVTDKGVISRKVVLK